MIKEPFASRSPSVSKNPTGPAEIIVREEERSLRLDLFIARQLQDWSRSHLQEVIRNGFVSVNGRVIRKPSHRLDTGDRVTIVLVGREPPDLTAEHWSLEILYEDEDLLAINKPRGVLVHPAGDKRTGTIANALLALGIPLSTYAGRDRPGIVHRLDKGTSGVLLVAKNDGTHRQVIAQLAGHRAEKVYLALVVGSAEFNDRTVSVSLRHDPQDPTRIVPAVRLPGKSVWALTRFQVLKRWQGFSLIKAQPLTGRTHQIRVHLKVLGLPIVGDREYGGYQSAVRRARELGKRRLVEDLRKLNGFALHAQSVTLSHPRTGNPLTVRAPLPDDMKALIASLDDGENGTLGAVGPWHNGERGGH